MVPLLLRTMLPLSLHAEDGGNTVLRNIGILPHHFTTSQPRRPRLQYLSEWKGQVSLPIYPFPRGPLFKYILRIRFSSFLSTWFHHCCVKCVAISLTYKDKETPTLVSIWYSTKTGNAKCTCGVMKQTLPREFLALDHVHALNLSGVSDGCRRTIDG